MVKRSNGDCVIQYIVDECQRTPRLKYVTRPYVVSFFGKNCLTDGISTEQIIKFAKHIGYSNVYALDPFFHTFDTYTCSRDTKINLVLTFVVNNGHCYPILDKSLKHEIAKKHRIDLKDYLHELSFKDYDYLETSCDKNQFLQLTTNKLKDIVLVNSNDLSSLASHIITNTGYIIEVCHFYGPHLASFEHPQTKQIIVAAQDLVQRRTICQEMYDQLNCWNLNFTNQSYAELASTWFQLRYGNLHESSYGNDLKSIYDTYKIAPYIVKLSTKYKHDNVKGFDIRRDYTGILINNEVDYNVFTDFDYIEEFTGKLTAGEYYVDCVIWMANKTIKLSNNWYPYVFVKYLLDNQYITLNNIKYVIRPSHMLPANTFKDFAQTLYDNYKENGSKELVNCFIGGLNRQSLKNTKGCMTDSYEMAMGILLNQEEKGEPCNVYKVGDLYFLRRDDRTPLTKGHVPIWRHIIASSYIQLDKLYKSICGPKTTVIAYRTDSIKVINPIDIQLSDDPKPGDIREEHDIRKIEGRSLDEIEMKPAFVHTPREVHYEPENIEFAKAHSCIVTGMPGCGKTEMIKKLDDNFIVLCFTNKAVDEVRNRGVKNVQTFDSFFFVDMKGKPYENIKKYDRVVVDEFSMVPYKFYGYLNRVKQENLNIKFNLFGDVDQCKPVEGSGKWYDYTTNPLTLNLVDYNIMKVEYKPQFARYDKTLYDILIYFKQHMKLPYTLHDRKWLVNCLTGISKWNKSRAKANEKCQAIYEAGKQSFTIDKKKWIIGQPIISIDNIKHNQIYRSALYSIVSYAGDTVVISDAHKVNIDVKTSEFNKIFEDGFCLTVYKAQGGTIRDHYNIYNHDKMSFQEMYTALSRGVSLDKVHFPYLYSVHSRYAR